VHSQPRNWDRREALSFLAGVLVALVLKRRNLFIRARDEHSDKVVAAGWARLCAWALDRADEARRLMVRLRLG